NKQMSAGGGGMVTTAPEEQWERLAGLRNQGRADTDGWLDHSRYGYNDRLDDISAAVGIAQLEKLDELLAARAEVAERYNRLLAAVDGVEPPLADDADHRLSWFVYVVKLARELDRDGVIARL